MANTVVWAEEWAERLQQRLSEPVKFKDICDVRYTNIRVLNNPYLTDPTVQTGTRGTAYSFQDITETNESLTISTYKVLPQFIDRADLAQSTFLSQMELADRQAVLINETIETAMLANTANMTHFGSGDITGGTVADTTQITVSPTNIDDIIRHIKRVIRVAGGEALMNQNGVFIVWRPADLEVLEGFMQANGFAMADAALRDGGTRGYGGFRYLGVDHYSSNLLPANKVVAGIKGIFTVGILKDTYGQIMVDEKDPNLQSGISIVSRVDYGVKIWTKTKPVILDVNVV